MLWEQRQRGENYWRPIGGRELHYALGIGRGAAEAYTALGRGETVDCDWCLIRLRAVERARAVEPHLAAAG